jgi:hypothetical protein
MNALPRFAEDQQDETPHVEARIARLESDVEHIKAGVQRLEVKTSAANDAIVALTSEVAHLATKAELNRVEGELKASIAGVEGRLDASIASVKGELTSSIASVEGKLTASIASLKGELTTSISNVHGALDARINAMESKILKWVVGTGLGAATLALAVVKFTSPPVIHLTPATVAPASPAAEVAREPTK